MASAEAMLANAYAIEDRNLAAWGGKESLRLELLMDYSEAFAADSADVYPVAAVRWAVLSDEFQNETSVREFKIIVAAFLYAKALALDQLRAELFENVGNALRLCLASGDVSSNQPLSKSEMVFAPMFLKGRRLFWSFKNIVWPWDIASWSDVEARRPRAVAQSGFAEWKTMTMHTATLLTGPPEPNAPGGAWLRYRGDATLTRIFIPAAALIAISHVWQNIPEGRGMMYSLLKNINDYHDTPEQITFDSDARAMNAAMEVLLSAGKRKMDEFRGR